MLPQDPHGHFMETNPARIGCAPTFSRLDDDRGEFASPRTPSTESHTALSALDTAKQCGGPIP
ncbi:MAG: hypothetical protein H6855_07350 [Rhodospirillales bacterium]|nr:hypothetical protein [Rhodospirillales bacterium]